MCLVFRNWAIVGCTLMYLAGCKPQAKKEEEQKVETEQTINYLEESEADKDARMEWWHDARFGMFIHWGVYSQLGGEWNGKKNQGNAEWIMNDLKIPVAEYETLAPTFNPTKFNAKEWVNIAKVAGMKYIVITSKHHDGFGLWDSDFNDWDMGGTPFGRDPLKELQQACRVVGIKLGFYHSVMDWHHPDAQAQFYPEYNVFPKDDSVRASVTFKKYLDEKMKPQLEELLTNYGDVAVVWFDGEWVNGYTSEMGKEVYQFVRELQPSTIVNNRVDKGRNSGEEGMDGEGEFAGDFGTPEQEIPETGLPDVDWETCQTLNNSWGYKSFDDDWKSAETMIRQLVDIVSKGGNLLLNVGPTGEGVIPEPSVEVLKAMGKWLEINGESIYGTTASPIEAPEWGRITSKGETLYLHVLNWPKNGMLKAELDGAFTKATLVASGEEVGLEANEEGISLQVPQSAPHEICSVIKLEK